MARIGDALRGLRYGSVLAIVQDGVVVQIERTEKTRLGKSDR
ncbi:MAG: YezD family protein [Planctomycetia bacterium]|nr:YezD family protein [Planctomycetia bacterium]